MKSFHCSCVARHNLIGCCRLSLRIVASPIPALLTRISITPNRPCALETISDRLVAGEVGLDRHEVGSLLTFLHRLRELVETLGGAVDTGALEPWLSKPSTIARPVPSAAPVTIATRCCS